MGGGERVGGGGTLTPPAQKVPFGLFLRPRGPRPWTLDLNLAFCEKSRSDLLASSRTFDIHKLRANTLRNWRRTLGTSTLGAMVPAYTSQKLGFFFRSSIQALSVRAQVQNLEKNVMQPGEP